MIRWLKGMGDKGFTLIELCVGISLFVLIFAGMSQIFASAYQVYENAIERNTALQSSRAVLAIVKNEIEAADRIDSPIVTEEKSTTTVSRLQYQKSGVNYALYQSENKKDELCLESNIEKKNFHIEGLESINFCRNNNQQIKFTVHIVYKTQSKEIKEVITMLN